MGHGQGPSCLWLCSVLAGQGAASDQMLRLQGGRVTCLQGSCPSVLPLKGGQRQQAVPGGSTRSQHQVLGPRSSATRVSAQQGCLGTPRTCASRIEACDTPSFDQRAPPYLSVSYLLHPPLPPA